MAITRLALRCIEYPAPDYLIAQACGVSPGKFSLMQQGKSNVSMNLAIRLAAIFRCRVSEVIGWASDTEEIVLDGGIADVALANDHILHRSSPMIQP